MKNTSRYAHAFSEESFWDKLLDCLQRVGRELVEKALTLLYALQDPQVPAWAKSVIVAALGYFISPLDAIPDPLPGGFADDLGVLAGALATVMAYVSPATVKRAKARANELFGARSGEAA